MTIILNASKSVLEDGQTYVVVEIEKDGKNITRNVPYFNADGSVNEKAEAQYNRAIDIINKQNEMGIVASQTVNKDPVQQQVTPLELAKNGTIKEKRKNNNDPNSAEFHNNGELLLAIQMLNPSLDIVVEKNYLSSFSFGTSHTCIGLSVSNKEDLKLPNGYEFFLYGEGSKKGRITNKYKHPNRYTEIEVSEPVIENDKIYFNGLADRLIEGSVLPKDIKDLSLSTNINEVFNLLCELNPGEVFELEGNKINTTFLYTEELDRLFILPWGFKIDYDKETDSDCISNDAGLKIKIEYSEKLSDEMDNKDKNEKVDEKTQPEQTQVVQNNPIDKLAEELNALNPGMNFAVAEGNLVSMDIFNSPAEMVTTIKWPNNCQMEYKFDHIELGTEMGIFNLINPILLEEVKRSNPEEPIVDLSQPKKIVKKRYPSTQAEKETVFNKIMKALSKKADKGLEPSAMTM